MTRSQKEALKSVGITTESYYVEATKQPKRSYDLNGYIGPIWGLALIRRGEVIAVVESYSADSAMKGYYLRSRKSERTSPIPPSCGIYKLQRLAVADLLRVA